eukprot:GEMP01018077.1.p1 GENE.GEMP01018077.1~~GEMP01018077.1.p1  ORF type:complete len:742 (+),score=176.37 GEMP01018077.1:29-2227(+)
MYIIMGDSHDADNDGDPSADEGELKLKLHIFQSAGVQTVIEQFWRVCSDEGGVSRDCYVEINLRMQKALVPDVQMEDMLESAQGDWKEDSPENKPLNREDFALFLFELTALWCHTNVTLSSYLLFLSSTFIWVTKAKHPKGAVILKNLDSIDFLPGAFFELLVLAPQEDERWSMISEEQRFGLWYLQNFGREQETLLLVQRQVFALTHDIRSVFLFHASQSHDFLSLVKRASLDLTKIFPKDTCLLPEEPVPKDKVAPSPREGQVVHDSAVVPGLVPRVKSKARVRHIADVDHKSSSARQKRPAMEITGDSFEKGPHALRIDHREAVSTGVIKEAPHAVVRRPVVADGHTSVASAAQNLGSVESVARGSISIESTADEKVPASYTQSLRPKTNLMICGAEYLKAARPLVIDKRLSPSPLSSVEPSLQPFPPSPKTEAPYVVIPQPRQHMSKSNSVSSASPAHSGRPSEQYGKWRPLDSEHIAVDTHRYPPEQQSSPGEFPQEQSTPLRLKRPRRILLGVTPQRTRSPGPNIPVKKKLAAKDAIRRSLIPPEGLSVLVDDLMKELWGAQYDERKDGMRIGALGDAHLGKSGMVGKYALPKRPKDIYRNQVQPFTKLTGSEVIQGAASNMQQTDPFGNLVEKLCYKDSLACVAGPWTSPTEPLWNELNHNLTRILKKVRKRMARRRRRRLKTKLFPPRAPPRRQDAGRYIRNFLDRPMEPGIGPYMEKALWGRA